MPISASFYRDANFVPITTDGIVVSKSLVISGNNTTVATPLFSITGTIETRGLWGIVTTTLGANHTAAYWRLNDQTAQLDITVSTGTILSAAPAGSIILKKTVRTNALSLLSSVAGAINEPASSENIYFTPFILVKKTAAATNIEYVYSTTDTPTTGAITFFVRWLPLSVDANITPL